MVILSPISGPQEGRADYQFNAAEAGTYTFWIRANPIGDPKLDYQLNGGDWIPIDFKNATDLINIAKDNKPDLRFIAWIDVGSVNLQTGQNTIAFKFHSENNNHGSLDCFLFTQTAFAPNGKLKPGEKLGTDEPGWWAFEPSPETFGKDALLDLRPLNEDEAGQSGFVQADGDSFKLGNGQPVRFWAVNTSAPPGDLTKAQMDLMAARFAKLGINMVRIHGGLFDRSGDDPTKIDAARLDNYFYLVNALKKQGIYVHLSNYFPLWLTVKASDGIPGTDDIIGKIPFALLIFEPRMQEILQVVAETNPHHEEPLFREDAGGGDVGRCVRDSERRQPFLLELSARSAGQGAAGTSGEKVWRMAGGQIRIDRPGVRGRGQATSIPTTAQAIHARASTRSGT